MIGSIEIRTTDGFTNTIPVIVSTAYAEKILDIDSSTQETFGPFTSLADTLRAFKFTQNEWLPRGFTSTILDFPYMVANTDDEAALKEVFPNARIGDFTASSENTTLLDAEFPIGRRIINNSYCCYYYTSSGGRLPVVFPYSSAGGRTNIPRDVSSTYGSYYNIILPVLRDDFAENGVLKNIFLSPLSNSTGCETGKIGISFYFNKLSGQTGWYFSYGVGKSTYLINSYSYMSLAPNYNTNYSDFPTSIYGPGGETSGNPHNPYPGGSSGSNPGTNDPLNSGTDTTSASTPGTWELPFDEVPDAPATVHSVDLGLYNVYALSAAQVKELANYLFSGVTELGENLVKLIWGSKRDVIISLYEFPLMVTTQGTDTIRFIFDTDLAGLFHGKQLTSEYIPIDFGTIKVDRYSGTFYDFEPYTTLTLYIPYIGYVDLKPTEVVGSTLSIRGYVHLTTGELTVNVRSSRTGILGSYSGTIGRMLPIADADATDIYASIIKTAASLGAVALAGAGMATASRAVAGISTPNKQTVDSARDTYMQSVGAWGSATRGVRGREASMLQAQGAYEKAQADYAEQSSKYNAAQSAVRANREDFHDSASDAISNSLDAVTTGFGVSRGTVMTSSNGRVSPQRCFLRIEVPHQNVSRQQKILGYPANTSDALNSDRLHGYTELRTIELSIPNATLTEIQELEDILRGGFYLP